MNSCRIIFVVCMSFIFYAETKGQHIYTTQQGNIQFVSEAPLEIISASSKKMEGVIDADAFSFAISVPIRSFEGFNNGLQRQHFYENYMETNRYPTATFSGKCIEKPDLTVPGKYSFRTKGNLVIHGRSTERIIKIEVESTGLELQAKTSFLVPLADHEIEVPGIVNQKIAKEIQVHVEATFLLSGKS